MEASIMNYKHVYYTLIDSRKQLCRIKGNNGLFETHHIIPKSLGGTDDKDNLVLLTPREHYVAHWLLYKIHEGKNKAKMAYAFFGMCKRNPNQQRTVTSRQFELAKKYMSESCSGKNHHNYGKQIWTEEQKKQISERQKGKNNSMYGRVPWNKGLTKETNDIVAAYTEARKGRDLGFVAGHMHSEETKQKISKAHKGKRLSHETKEKLSAINKGKKLSKETRKRMSESRKGTTHNIVTCPRCGKSGGHSAMYRWHFDNCKEK